MTGKGYEGKESGAEQNTETDARIQRGLARIAQDAIHESSWPYPTPRDPTSKAYLANVAEDKGSRLSPELMRRPLNI